MKKPRCRLRAVSLFSWSVEQKGARHAYHPARDWRRARFSRLAANQRSRRHALSSLNLKKKRETARSLSKVWQEKDLIFPPFQNYLQVPCQKLKKGTKEDHHEHQLTPEAGQMIYHISQVSQPTNTLKIKEKELFAFIGHSVMHATQLKVTLYSAAYLIAWNSYASHMVHCKV